VTGASAGVLNPQRAGKHQNISQQFSTNHKSPRVGVVTPLTTPARYKYVFLVLSFTI